MSNLVSGLLGVLLATNQPAAVSNLVHQTTGVSVEIVDPNDPLEKEYQKLLADDDASQAEVDRWIRENEAFAAQGGGVPKSELNRRIEARFAPIRKSYEDFLSRHPNHTRARLAYGSFLSDIRDEDAAEAQWEKTRELDPKNSAAWNNLANLYTHNGRIKQAFEGYAKAIELNPTESLYYHNLADTVYLFRRDAMAYYNLTEQEVFDKALDLYRKALKRDPGNFLLATDLAQSYYGIKPTRTDEALTAWTNAMTIARDDIEREGVYIHLARFKLNAGRFEEARAQLDAVTNPMYGDLKKRLTRTLAEKEKQSQETHAPPEAPPSP